MSQSDVARIRKQIELEYQSAQFIFSGFGEVGKHEFLTRRQENIAGYFLELQQHLSSEEAMHLIRSVSETK